MPYVNFMPIKLKEKEKKKKETQHASFLCGPLLAQEKFILSFVPGNIGHSHQNPLSLSWRLSSKAPICPSASVTSSYPWTWVPYFVFLKLRERVPRLWNTLLKCMPPPSFVLKSGETHLPNLYRDADGNIQIMRQPAWNKCIFFHL